jgi:hypothetical protein
VLLAVLTVIATLAQLPVAAAETGGVGQGEEAPVLHHRGLDVCGPAQERLVGTGTWESRLNFTPYRMRWSGSRARAGISSSRMQPPSRPLSASLPARAYEIRPGPAP